MKIAIVGASADRSKYGNKILRDLHKKGHEVFPVNPKEKEIEGIKCFNSIIDLPLDIEVVNIVTPPSVTLEILKKLNDIGQKNVWCQPGSADEKVKEFLKVNNFKYLVDSCIMMSHE